VNSWKIWGQDELVSELRSSFPAGIRHSYVISGPGMSGKSTLAMALAKALLCLQPPRPGDFCDACRSCRSIARGLHPDVSRFDLGTQAETAGAGKSQQSLSIDTVREVGRSVTLRPIEGSWRVVIVDDVESMQETAQEAFLKTLEEPPSFTVLLLLTTDANSLLPTILSRCVMLRVRPTSTDVVEAALLDAGIEESTARETALVSHGLVGWAFQAQSDPSLRETRLNLVRETMDWIGADGYQRVVTAVRQADRFATDKEALFDRLQLVMLGWRSVMLRGLNMVDANSILDASSSIRTESIPLEACARAIASVGQCIFDLESNVRPRLAMQTMVRVWPELTS
jgi:DNA polymerase-3 subunit delta'